MLGNTRKEVVIIYKQTFPGGPAPHNDPLLTSREWLPYLYNLAWILAGLGICPKLSQPSPSLGTGPNRAQFDLGWSLKWPPLSCWRDVTEKARMWGRMMQRERQAHGAERRPLGPWFLALSESWTPRCPWSAGEVTVPPYDPAPLFVEGTLVGFCCNQGVLADTWTLGPAFSFLCICETDFPGVTG